MKKFLIATVILLLFSSVAMAQSSVSNIQKRGVLRVGSEVSYMPFEMKDKNGNDIGFDMEIARGFAESLGVKLEIINTPWDDLIPNLNNGKFDMVITGMTITGERKKQVDFSIPYFAAGQALLINKNKKDTIKSFRDINNPNVRVVSKKGTTAGDLVETFFTKAHVTLIDAPEKQILQHLLAGRADVFVYDMPYLSIAYSEHQDRLVFIPDPFTYEPFGAAVKKGNTDLLNAINKYFQTIRENGEYDRMFQYWILGSEWTSMM